MFVSSESFVVFSGIPTTTEERIALRSAGFVHITGLQVYDRSGKPEYKIGERLTRNDTGKSGGNNGKNVIVTPGGEVWITVLADSSDTVNSVGPIFERFCPNGGGAFVPLSNGEEVSIHRILERITNPSAGLLVQQAQ